MYLPIRVDGTGAYNSSEYYARERNQWEAIESQAWLDELVKWVPAGLQIRKRNLAEPADDAGRSWFVPGRRRQLLSDRGDRPDSASYPF